MRLTIVTIALALAVSGPALAASKADYEKAASAADSARKAANAVDGEWRDVGKILKKADKAAKKNNYKKAIELAKKAEMQSKLGQMQAKAEAARNPVHPSYLR